MEEQEVEEEVLAADLELHLAADEREADAELEEEVAHVRYESALEVSLLRLGPEGEEVEDVRVLQRLLREVRARRRQRGLEVGQRLASALVQGRFDLGDEHVAR